MTRLDNDFELVDCVRCKGEKKPELIKVDGMYYVECPCHKWQKYQFLGLRASFAAEAWNAYNKKTNHGGGRTKKNK